MKFTAQKLDNGLTVMTDEIPDARVSSVRWCVRGGSRQDKEGGEGHFFEHLFSSSHINDDDCEAMESLVKISPPAETNFTTGHSAIKGFALVLPRFIPKAIGIIGNAVAKPNWKTPIFAREQARILIEHELGLSNGDRMIYEEACKLAYENNALSRNFLGTVANIEAMTEQKCMEYYDTCFKANIMALTVSGPVRHEDIMRHADQAFGSIQPGIVTAVSKPEFAAFRQSAVIRPNPLQKFSINFDAPPSTTHASMAGSFMLSLLQNKLHKVFTASGNYSAPNTGRYHFSDCSQYVIQWETSPAKVADAINTIKDIIDDPALWLTEKAYEAEKLLDETIEDVSFLDPRHRARNIDFQFEMQGEAISYEEINARSAKVTFNDVAQAYTAWKRNEFNLIGYGPMEKLLAPALS